MTTLTSAAVTSPPARHLQFVALRYLFDLGPCTSIGTGLNGRTRIEECEMTVMRIAWGVPTSCAPSWVPFD